MNYKGIFVVKGSGSGIFPDPDSGDPKRPDPDPQHCTGIYFNTLAAAPGLDLILIFLFKILI